MGPVRAEIEIDAPRQRVFDSICDLAWRPSFTDHFVSNFHLTRLDSAGPGAGARFRFDVPPRRLWTDVTILESDAPRRLLERGEGGRENRISSTTLWQLDQGPGALTSVQVCHWMESSHRFDRAVESLGASSFWYERAWRKALRRLRDQLELGELSGQRASVAGGSPHTSVAA